MPIVLYHINIQKGLFSIRPQPQLNIICTLFYFMFNPLTAKFINENVLPLKVVSRSRDSQLQEGESYSNLTKLKGHAQV